MSVPSHLVEHAETEISIDPQENYDNTETVVQKYKSINMIDLILNISCLTSVRHDKKLFNIILSSPVDHVSLLTSGPQIVNHCPETL